MKILLLFTFLITSVLANTKWTHQVSEGQGGGVGADYYFYKAFSPKSGSSVMSVLKARVVYAYDYPDSKIIRVVDYDFNDGVRIQVSNAKKADIEALTEGKDVKMKVLRAYKIPYDLVIGQMIKPKKGTRLSDEQYGDLFNLIHVLAMERGPISSSEQGALANP